MGGGPALSVVVHRSGVQRDRNLWSCDDRKGYSPEDQQFLNIGSRVALVRHDPDIYVNIQEIASPQYILGISEDKTAPGTPVVNWNNTNADGQKWLLVLYK